MEREQCNNNTRTMIRTSAIPKGIKEIASPKSITEYALDMLTEQIPPFAHDQEKAFINEICNYTNKIIKLHSDGKLADETPEAIEEEYSGDVLSSVCVLNTKYFEAGLQFGASLILQLLGFN